MVGRRWWEAGEALDDVDPVTLDAYQRAHRDHAPRPALATLTAADRPRIALLGAAGTGKSTLARSLAFALTSPDGDGTGLAGFLPLLVEPRHRDDEGRHPSPDPAGLLHEVVCGPPVPVVDGFLRRGGRAVLIVDGVDEVAGVAGRASLLGTIARWARRYPQARVVITSRVDGYDRFPLDRAGFHHYEIEEAGRIAAPTGLPPAGLPVRVARSLWQGCDGELINRVSDPESAAEIAAAVSGDGEGLWRAAGDGAWRFAERAVLEHAVAADMAGRLTGDEIGDAFVRYWREPSWQAVLPRLAGMLDTAAAGEVLRRLVTVDPLWRLRPEGLPRHVMLAARCLAEMGDPGAGAAAMVEALTTAVEMIDEESPLVPEFVCAVRPALTRHARLGERYRVWYTTGSRSALATRIGLLLLGPDSEFLRWVRYRVANEDLSRNARVALVQSLVGSDDPDSVPWLTGLIAHRDVLDGIRAELFPRRDGGLGAAAVSVLTGIPGTAALLAEHALDDDSVLVRRAAVPGIRDLSLLGRIAADDTDADVRLAATRAVVQLAPTDPATRALLADRATADEDPEVRVATIDLLRADRHHDPGTTRLLWRLLDDEQPEVRGAAVRAVADAPDLLPRLRELLSDPAWTVRNAAARAAGAYWRHDPGTVELLVGCATEDDSATVRQAAVSALAGRVDDPETAERLIGWAVDDDWAVRRAATLALAEYGPAESRALLREYVADGPDEHAHLAVAALASGWPRDPATVAALRRVAENGFHHTRLAALAALAADPEHAADARSWWYGLLTHEDEPARAAAVPELANRWPDHPDTLAALLVRAGVETEPEVRALAVRVVGARWPGHPDVAAVLRKRTSADRDRTVREAALAELAGGWAGDPGTAELLRERAETDPEMIVRRAAAYALVSARPEDPETADWLRRRTAVEPDGLLRRQLLGTAIESWPGDPATVAWLLDVAGTAADEEMRSRAAQSLRDRWPDHPDVVAFFGRQAVADPNPEVRAAAVGALRGAATHRLVLDRVVHDSEPVVRAAAVAALAAHARGEPGSLTAVRDRVVHDDVGSVRRRALESLAAGWPDDAGTAPLLRDRLSADPAAEVRSMAAQVLVECRPDDSRTRALLHESARTEPDWETRWSIVDAVLSRWRTRSDTVDLLRYCTVTEPNHLFRLRAVDRLAALSNSGTLAWIRECAAADQPGPRLAIVQPLRATWPEHPDTPVILLGLASDAHELVRKEALEELVRGGWESPDIRAVLRDRATDPVASVREVAVHALGRHADDPDVAELLFALATTDDDSVRWRAVRALDEDHWPDRPEVLVWLREHAAADPDDYIRSLAITTLAKRWPDDPGTRALLHEVAAGRRETEGYLRSAAISALGTAGDADTRALLSRLACSDSDSRIRREAVAALTHEWSLDPDTLTLVRELALAAPHSEVRWAALSALIVRKPPGTSALLRQGAVDDPDAGIRAHLLEELADLARDDPDTADLLADRAHHDPDSEVRALAEETLAALGQPPRTRCACHLY